MTIGILVVETMMIFSAIEFIKVKLCNRNTWSSSNFNPGAAKFSQLSTMTQVHSHLHAQVYINHHFVKCMIAVLRDMDKSLHMTIIHIKESVC